MENSSQIAMEPIETTSHCESRRWRDEAILKRINFRKDCHARAFALARNDDKLGYLK